MPFAHPQAMCARHMWAYLSEKEVKDLKQKGLENMKKEVKKAEARLRDTEKLRDALVHRLRLAEAGVITSGGGIPPELAKDCPLAAGNAKISDFMPDPEADKQAVEGVADHK